jgi:Mn2+/Fe2+ NRAMP family transporter
MENTTEKNYRDIENLALLMDDRFELFGFKFGLNFIIDLIPVAGDVITTLIALYILTLARKYNLSKPKVFHMLFNIAVYFIVGLIPWAGDLFGAWWKPNKRNVKLLLGAVEK